MYTENEYKNRIFNEDSLEGLKKLPDNCIDCCVTSPPYYALRDYGVDGQIGLEHSPEEYIRKLTEVFTEVLRVLKPEGTLWLNIGDTYNGNKKGNTNPKFKKANSKEIIKIKSPTIKNKDLIGIPWMLAFSLRSLGWYLRQDIIWHKPNSMPESVTDRCTKSHEYIFLMSKSQRYYFDYEAISEQCADQSITNYQSGMRSNGINKDRNDNDFGERSKTWKPRTKNCMEDGQKPNTMHLRREEGLPDKQYAVRNKRDVWSVNVKPDTVAHFATYPEELIKPCILAGSRRGGYVLDPFMGSGTTAMVARKLNRNFVGFELNRDYIKICEEKIKVTPDLFY